MWTRTGKIAGNLARGRAGAMASLVWSNTNSSLGRLGDLLNCPICHCRMTDPSSLGSCNHHFCRSCIEHALCERGASCPLCHVPAWVKDVKSDRQMATLIKLVATMSDLTSGLPTGEDRGGTTMAGRDHTSLPTSTRDHTLLPTSTRDHTSLPTSTRDHTSLPTSTRDHTSLPTSTGDHTSLPTSTACEDVTFKVPAFDGKSIQRRLKSRRRTSQLYPSCSLSRDEHKSTQPSLTQQSAVPASLAQQPATVSVQQPDDMFFECPLEISSIDDKSTAETDLKKPGIESSVVSDSNKINDFFFPPLVPNTRQYTRLQGSARVKRLRNTNHCEAATSRGFPGRSSARLHQSKVTKFLKEEVVTSRQTQQGIGEGRGESAEGSAHSKSHTPGTPGESAAHAKTTRRNIRGETPLHIVAIKGEVAVARSLLQQGANVNVKDNAGWTPLHECCNHGHLDVVTLLLDHGALVNTPGFDNDTPLHDAVTNGHVRIASLLVSRGANPLLRNRHGAVPRDLAVSDAMKKALRIPSSTFSPNLLVSPNSIISPSIVHASSQSGGQLVLLCTGLKSYQKVQLVETAQQLGAKVVDSFSAQVSHLITTTDKSRCCSRTLKFLCAVAKGKWIVSFQWVSRCQQEGRWVEEAPYEVMGIMVREQSLITEAPRLGRENALLQAPGLFDGCELFFPSSFIAPQPSKEDLVRLVKMAGGTVLGREPRARSGASNPTTCPYHAKPDSLLSTCHSIIVSNCSTDTCREKKKNTGTAQAPPSWILDCLSHFQLLDISY